MQGLKDREPESKEFDIEAEVGSLGGKTKI